MEKRCQINQKVCGQFERACHVIDDLLCIVAHDERVRSKGLGTGDTLLPQACDGGSAELAIIHHEHGCSPTLIPIRSRGPYRIALVMNECRKWFGG
ncbi:hypothetical protein [Ktedonobacter racemifer]|uniref:hypothetical protein n=1 Tax=Ktedonobacter racemifer TaxID=363277 RepID=UPI0012F8FC1B|nr:hypothetical protein [Ktedonobacter racemifer]